MTDAFRRRYAGTHPWEETWFLEVLDGTGRGIWLRWVLAAGEHSGCTVWAMTFSRQGVAARRDPFPLAELSAGDGFGRTDGSVVLERDRASGSAGDVSWDLRLVDLGRRHQLVPDTIERLNIGRTYTPAIADLAVSGVVTVAGERWELEAARGVLGHLYGAKNRTTGWTWAHCNHFDGSDALFEALSVRLGASGLVSPPLTTLVLHLDGRRWAFNRARELMSIRSRFGGSHWAFEARREGVSLRGEAELNPRPARVGYTDPDGRASYCHNSPRSRLRLHVVDREAGIDRELTSRLACFEIGSRDPGSELLDLP